MLNSLSHPGAPKLLIDFILSHYHKETVESFPVSVLTQTKWHAQGGLFKKEALEGQLCPNGYGGISHWALCNTGTRCEFPAN